MRWCARRRHPQVRYFKFFPKNYILILTLRYALPKSVRFLMCAVIIYFAYALLGMSLFGEGCDAFADLGASFQTLFAIVNGDHITEYMNTLASAGSPFLSRIFVYSFVFLCMWVSLNILLALVGEGYKQAIERVRSLSNEADDAPHGTDGQDAANDKDEIL